MDVGRIAMPDPKQAIGKAPRGLGQALPAHAGIQSLASGCFKAALDLALSPANEVHVAA